MKKWYVSAKKADFNRIGETFGIDPVIARIIRNRDITSDEEIDRFLHPDSGKMGDAALMADIDKGATLLLSEIKQHSKLRVIGDYDIDGISATFVLLKGIRALGGDVDYDIPDRIKDGYGINRNLIDRAKAAGIEVIITCDNGIAAVDEISYAKELGMRVIITDHHAIPFVEEEGERREILPDADAVINPHRSDCAYPFKGLCGALVAYRFMCYTFDCCGADKTVLDDMYDILSIATVGDVMDLIGENRTIVSRGLKQIASTKNVGLQALIDVNGLSDGPIGVYHIGFVIGPCINAGGRLETAKIAVSLLLSEDKAEADALAKELFELNVTRKDMTLAGVDKAIEEIENNSYESSKVLVIYIQGCHESLVGIIAGRIREKYYRPVIVLTDGDGAIKGSGRSIEEYNMFEELTKCSDLVLKFGGHAMAAGMTLEAENVDALRKRLNDNCTLTDDDIIEKLKIDVPMPISYISESLINQISLLEPFGKGNPKPLFAQKDVWVLEARIIGRNKNVLKLKMTDGASPILEGVRFGEDGSFRQFIEDRFGKEEAEKLFATGSRNIKINVAYYPTINEYNGRRTINIHVEDYC
ncbi:MAG: single-stranded-DNA-specific exonuclease RecJ [Lachnospiraceae bacterium]|nr:single-stranded-DNA-specific exonuclease RecJ [Lachnospiraceae bacterium]